MRLDYHIDMGRMVHGVGNHTYHSTPTLTIAVISKDNYSEIVIPLDELKEALEYVDK